MVPEMNVAIQSHRSGLAFHGQRAIRKGIAGISVIAITAVISGCIPYSSANSAVGAPAPSATQVEQSVSRSLPARIRIPEIGVNAALMKLGLKANGALEVPPTSYTAGWFTGAPQPGRIGPAVIAAHVRWDGRAGAFARLSKLRAGDRIVVVRADSSEVAFSVDHIERFQKNEFPTKLVYGNINHAGLRLITCDGFDSSRRAYLANLVVFASLVK